MNLEEKLIEVRTMVDYAKKDATGGQYDYVSGTNLLSKIRPKIDELKISLTPHVVGPTEWKMVEEKGKTMYIVSSPMKMIWSNAEDKDDKIIPVDWFLIGKQNDPSKAYGSGLTYAFRYFLMNYFNIPNDKLDPDAFQEKHGPQIEFASLNQRKELGNIAELSKWTINDIKKHCEDTYAVKSSAKLTESQIRVVTSYIEGNPKTQEKATSEPEPPNPDDDSGPGEPEKDAGQLFRDDFKNLREPGLPTFVFGPNNKDRIMDMKEWFPDIFTELKDRFEKYCTDGEWPHGSV